MLKFIESFGIALSCKLHKLYDLLIHGNDLIIINLYFNISNIIIYVLMSDSMVGFKMQECIIPN